ncbi:hypothetical protein ABT224_41540 [Streptomyces sp. NPDC001584]|uniref:hypothetical protein n=1 Tax=Streptomyces sp. NPDC001584 TaxID=3154521 RepID=UPI0033214350
MTPSMNTSQTDPKGPSMTTDRCTAAHSEDPTACAGPHDAVTILDAGGTTVTGCEHHGARLLASLDGARVEPGTVLGAATRVFAAADGINPFPWLVDAPRTKPGQLSAAANRAAEQERLVAEATNYREDIDPDLFPPELFTSDGR